MLRLSTPRAGTATLHRDPLVVPEDQGHLARPHSDLVPVSQRVLYVPDLPVVYECAIRATRVPEEVFAGFLNDGRVHSGDAGPSHHHVVVFLAPKRGRLVGDGERLPVLGSSVYGQNGEWHTLARRGFRGRVKQAVRYGSIIIIWPLTVNSPRATSHPSLTSPSTFYR